MSLRPVAMIAVLAACGSREPGTAPEAAPPTEAAETLDKLRLDPVSTPVVGGTVILLAGGDRVAASNTVLGADLRDVVVDERGHRLAEPPGPGSTASYGAHPPAAEEAAELVAAEA